MNDLIKINDTSLEVKEYNGQRVVTFKDIDTVHSRPNGTARKRFNDNKAHFIEGEDYFKICASEIRTHKIMDISPKAHEDVTFITESGYLMLVKSFTDELAWNVQRQLVNVYFRAKENTPDFSTLSPQLQFMIQMEQRQNELEQRQAALENKLDEDRTTTIKETLSYGRINSTLRKEISTAVKMKSLEICYFASTFDKMGKRVMANIYKSLQKHFNVESYNDLTFNQYTDAIIFIKLYEPDTKLSVAITKAMPKVDMSLLSSIMETKQNVKERET